MTAQTRVVIDHMACKAIALCMGAAPEVFEVGDDDRLHVLREVVDDRLLDRVQLAANWCPSQAISLMTDDEASQQTAEEPHHQKPQRGAHDD